MGADGATAVTPTEREPATIDIVRFVLLDETGPHDVLVFGCKHCPDIKLTSLQLEFHMKMRHQSSKFTVDAATRNRGRKNSPLSPAKLWGSTTSKISNRLRIRCMTRANAEASGSA